MSDAREQARMELTDKILVLCASFCIERRSIVDIKSSSITCNFIVESLEKAKDDIEFDHMKFMVGRLCELPPDKLELAVNILFDNH